MQIIWHGQLCFKIITPGGVILIDPVEEDSGLKIPRFQADVLVLTSPRKNEKAIVSRHSNPFLINNPGEYEIKGMAITGIPLPQNSSDQNLTIYIMEGEGIRLCHLGKINNNIPPNILEGMDAIDILMVPIGGKDAIDKEQAMKIINEIEPRIIIPMYYKTPGLKNNLDTVANFLREMGGNGKTLPKFVIKKKDLPQSETEIVILKPE